jgi:hypothetical protein
VTGQTTISTRDLTVWPDIPSLRRLLQSLAMLDAIVEREWEYRYYSFDSRWGRDRAMGSMRDGCGDHWFALLLPAGAGVVGLAHEAPMFRHNDPWPGLFAGLPPQLAELVSEPAFDARNCTYCCWRPTSSDAWLKGTFDYASGEDPDGSAELLWPLDGNPESYVAFASSYFERDLPVDAVAAVYAHEPLTRQLVGTLNAATTLADLEGDVSAIHYPRGAG